MGLPRGRLHGSRLLHGPEAMAPSAAIVQEMTWCAVRPGCGLLIALGVRFNVAYPIAMAIAPSESARDYEEAAGAIQNAAVRAAGLIKLTL